MPQKFVNLENLTSFWGNAKEYIGNERKEIEDQLYNWQKTEKAPIVQCEPVPNSELHPVVNFSFTETPPTEGEKSPDNPSTITGVSNISILHCGKNLLTPRQQVLTTQGVTFTENDDGSVTVNGTNNSSTNSAYYQMIPMSSGQYWKKTNFTYRLSGCPSGGSVSSYYITVFGTSGITDFGNGGTTTMASNGGAGVAIAVAPSATVSNIKFYPQLELGSTTTAFEKYTGNEYLLSLNDTYYGGFIDLSIGLMTVTWAGTIISNVTNVDTSLPLVNTLCFAVSTPFYHYGAVSAQAEYLICNRFVSAAGNDDTEHTRATGGASNPNQYQNIYINKSRLDFSSAVDPANPTSAEKIAAMNAWLTANPTTVCARLFTPYTVQLSSQQIKSLSSLEGTSKRINTVYTNVDSVQVEYQKYVGIDSTLDSNSVNAIQNKVVNSALNTKVSLSGDETISGIKTFSNTINGSVTGDAGTVAGHIVSKDVPVNAAFTDTTYDPATQSTAGLMSASDKVKLDAVGSVFSFKGSVTDSSSLPASNNVNGDAYLAEDTGHVHVYDGSSFVDIGVWAGIPSATDAQIDALFED